MSPSSTNNLMVNEIFDSIDGEGKTAGMLATFIRLTGCNLRCSYCDTEYAFFEGRLQTIEEIVAQVHYSHITLTGGEPLNQNVHPLISALHKHTINVETNGSKDIREYFSYPNAFFTVDYKCQSSGVGDAMFMDNFTNLRPQDVLKFVVGSHDDLLEAQQLTAQINTPAQIFISPAFGNIEPASIVEFCLKHHMEKWRVQLQLHKFIWNPKQRGV